MLYIGSVAESNGHFAASASEIGKASLLEGAGYYSISVAAASFGGKSVYSSGACDSGVGCIMDTGTPVLQISQAMLA